MSEPLARGVLYVHSSPRALCPHIEWAVGGAIGRALSFAWRDQPAQPGTQRAEFEWEGPIGSGAAIASALLGWSQVRFEVTEDPAEGLEGGRWMHSPELGIFHGQMDSAGNIVVPEDRIRAAMASAGADGLELHHQLRMAIGAPWDDELERFRTAGEDLRIVWLHRAG